MNPNYGPNNPPYGGQGPPRMPPASYGRRMQGPPPDMRAGSPSGFRQGPPMQRPGPDPRWNPMRPQEQRRGSPPSGTNAYYNGPSPIPMTRLDSRQQAIPQQADPLSSRKPSTVMDPRISQYSASLYSNGSPVASPEVPPIPAFPSDLSASLQTEFAAQQNSPRLPRSTSSYYPTDPFQETIFEEPESSRNTTPDMNVSPDMARSPALPHEDDISYGIIRQASLGRKHKAALTNISLAQSPPVPGSEFDGPPSIAASLVPAPLNSRPSQARMASPASSDRSAYPSEINRSLTSPSPSSINRAQSPAPTPYQGGGKLFLIPQRKQSLGKRVTKKPAFINVDQAEGRGSITSLPGLIKRALSLATNIDDRKSPAKQQDWFGNEVLTNLQKNGRNSTSLHSVLGAFPFSPSVGDDPEKSMSHRPAPKPPSTLNQSVSYPNPQQDFGGQSVEKRRKTYCGMPQKWFIWLTVGIIVLIAVCIIVPVAVVVIPKQSGPAVQTVASCTKSTQCANGGVSIVSATNTCQCICSNNFTGATCTQLDDSFCTTVDTTVLKAASIGNTISTIINGAQSTYQIPLDASKIVTLFGKSATACNQQNALVALGNSKRSVVVEEITADQVAKLPTTTMMTSFVTATATLAARQNVVTAGGIQFAGTASAPSAPSATSTITSGFDPNSAKMLGFAKTAVLYILQQDSSLDNAIVAQSDLNGYLSVMGNANPDSLPLGNGWTIDLVKLTVTNGKGQLIG